MKRRLRMLRSNNGVVPVYGQTANWVSSPERLLPPGFSLTRASTGTYFDSAGLLQTAPVNLCLQSQDFGTTWVATNAGTNATITVNTATAPDGTVTADSLIEDADNGHWVQQLITLTAAPHTFSVYVAPALRSWCQLQNFDGTTSRNCYFNLTGNGSVGTASGCTGRITPVGNGFYRCEITFTPLAAAGVIYVLGANADGGNNYAGSNGATAFYLWGAQVETGSAATSYIPTTTTVNSAARGTYRYPTTAPQSGQWGQLPGTAGSYFSTPDSAANSITGDIDIRVKAALVDWTPAAATRLIAKRDNVSTSFDFFLNVAGTLGFYDGATITNSSVVTGITDGDVGWVRVTRQASATELKFYTSADGVSWSQLGTTQSIPNVALTDTTLPVELGAYNTGAASNLSGKVYQAQIYNGINGTLAVNFDANDYTSGTTWTASTTGETWTRNGSATIQWPWVFDGTIVEAAATNLILRSQDFDNASWTKGILTVTADTTAAPDGTTTADTLTATGGGGYVQSSAVAAGASTAYAISVFAKKGNVDFLRLEFSDFTANAGQAWFNLNTGATGTTNAAGGATIGNLVIETAANGFYRCSMRVTTHGAAVNYYIAAKPSSTNGGDSANTNTVIVWGAQVETGGAATSYIPTTTAAVTRSADVVTAPVSGLLANAQGFAAIKGRVISDATTSRAYLSTFNGAGGIPIYQDGIGMIVFDGAFRYWNAIGFSNPTFGAIFSIATTWGGAFCNGAYNGTVGTPQTFDGSMDFGATLRIGDNVGAPANPISMVLQSLRLGIRAATNVELGSWTV